MQAVITITQLPSGHILMEGRGDFDFAEQKDTLIAKATMAAANAVNALIAESAGFEAPIVSGEAEAIEMLKGEKRSPAPPAHKTRWIDATTS